MWLLECIHVLIQIAARVFLENGINEIVRLILILSYLYRPVLVFLQYFLSFGDYYGVKVRNEADAILTGLIFTKAEEFVGFLIVN